MKLVRRRLIAVLVAIALVLIATGAQGSLAGSGIIYVDADATGENDGSSWEDAFTDLQPALEAAVPGDQIWVASGTYYPTVGHGGSGDRYRSFQMLSGVGLYGGFDPTIGDVAWQDRDWVTNVITLSGHIGLPEDVQDNCYHVFYHPPGTDLDSTAILDGFTISGGYADGEGDHSRGGGMFNDGQAPALRHCRFTGNAAMWGGGIYNTSSSPTLSSCALSGNLSLWPPASGDGAGMYNVDSLVTLANCTFADNVAHGYKWYRHPGGGMYNVRSTLALTGCVFRGNLAALAGGGMYNVDSSLTLTNCAFTDNESTGLDIARSTGGGMYNEDSSLTLANCTFKGNHASHGYGGGIYNVRSSPTLTNCTFTGNSAEHGGGGIYNFHSAPTVTNSILWADTADEIFNDDASSPPVTYSDIQGGCPGEGNIDADPLFVDAANGDFHLSLASPCIDAGSNSAPSLPGCDFEGDRRIIDGDGDGTATVDMGVDEVGDLGRFFLPVMLRGCSPGQICGH